MKKFDIYWNDQYIATGEYKNALQCRRAFAKLLRVSLPFINAVEKQELVLKNKLEDRYAL